MKNLMELKAILARSKDELKRKYNIKEMGIFGSYAYGLATELSDIDILVEFEKPIGLDFVTLAEELESLLGVKVDLVSANAIKPNMLPSVKEHLIYV
ncbi:MAG TPA: nucleotidyltransferase family protein [Ignavibacteriales bacterium]|nr:nucleotidyltransferase family protein [Ignavibacteriales bacterium]